MKHSLSQLITIDRDGILVSGPTGQPLARLQFQFSVGCQAYHVVELEQTETGLTGRTLDPKTWVEICYTDSGLSLELRGQFSETDSVCYFKTSELFCPHGRAFVPDADCRLFETTGKEEFYWTNSGMILQKQVSKKDLWMIAPPPHLMSFGENGSGWFGISIPEPLPVSHTLLKCTSQSLLLEFKHYSPVHSEGRLPRVFIDCGLQDSKAVLDRHREHAEALGLIQANKTCPDWWHNPVYCTWGDQCYLQKTQPRELTDALAIPMNETMILGWAAGIRSIYPGEVNYIIDAGWFDHLGDYDPKLSEFKSVEEFHRLILRLKADQFRVILWYTPFWIQPGSKIEKEHPDFLLRRRDGTIYRDEHKRAFLDFSFPPVREYTEAKISYLLQTLEADGFKIDMNYVHPLMSDVTMHDPSWGFGNQLWLQVLKFFHATATAVKPDAFFTISGIESYLQPYASSVRLNDLFDFDNAKAWYDRAEMVTRLMPGVPIDVDGWPASLEKMKEYQFVSPVFGAPVTYYIDAVDIMTTKLTEIERARMASVWHVYSKAPCQDGMQLTIDAELGLFERRDTEGKLQAAALNKSALVCYAANRIYVTSNREQALSLAIDPSLTYRNAEALFRDGRREKVNIFQDGERLLLHVQDSCNGILCYEIF